MMMKGLTNVFLTESAEAKLLALNLSHQILINSIAQGQAARNSATSNHPATAGGTMAFFEVVRALRDHLLPAGWKIENVRNLSMTVNPETNMAIVVSGGSKETGLIEGHPTTRNSKGEQTKSYLANNQRDLFGDLEETDESMDFRVIEGVGQTWLLLYFCDFSKREVRAELSLPTDIDSFGRVGAWQERIILDSIALDNVTIDIEPNFTPEIEIEIKRKA